MGMVMPERRGSLEANGLWNGTGSGELLADGGYRYGFGGQEKRNEIKGEGNSYTAEFWEYDPRVGRRWNVDPLTKEYAGVSPYIAMDNKPILKLDPDGKEWIISTTIRKDGSTLIKITFTGAILNSGSTSTADIVKFKAAAESQIKAAYTKHFSEQIYQTKNLSRLDGINIIVSVPVGERKTEVSIDVNLRFVSNIKDSSATDHLN